MRKKKKVLPSATEEPLPPHDMALLKVFQPGKTAYRGFFTSQYGLGGEILGTINTLIDEGTLPRKECRVYTGVNEATLHVILAVEPYAGRGDALAKLEQECARRLNLRFGVAPVESDEDYARFCDFIAFMHG